MADNDGKRLIESVSREALEKALADGALVPVEKSSSDPKKPPLGHVERVLTVMDRNMIVGAAREYCTREGHNGPKDREKLLKTEKVLEFSETIDYFATVDDAFEEKIIAWQGAASIYKHWRGYKAGAVTREELEKGYPDHDWTSEPPKPALRAPEYDKAERRGPERAFHLLAKLDVWIQDVVADAKPSIGLNEYYIELRKKFGFEGELPE